MTGKLDWDKTRREKLVRDHGHEYALEEVPAPESVKGRPTPEQRAIEREVRTLLRESERESKRANTEAQPQAPWWQDEFARATCPYCGMEVREDRLPKHIENVHPYEARHQHVMRQRRTRPA